VASAAGDVAAVADALGIERFAVMGHSGGARPDLTRT
jgi:pimeloyl-ACP methyl ester carboxylesterase